MPANEKKSDKQSSNEENDIVLVPLLLRGGSKSQVPEAQHTANLSSAKVSKKEFKEIIRVSIEMDQHYLKQFRERNRF
ncbi:MAG: hypothetical protein M1360_02480 [Candidatus Marsarchaeota archaeon]|jgi:hypothetical protein|nr:hypothetical protein [Candidatus Marsarchaeota archaeon]MCL5418784.1 hypothetical protein [Candidatus Marsarchaeota archaeon]